MYYNSHAIIENGIVSHVVIVIFVRQKNVSFEIDEYNEKNGNIECNYFIFFFAFEYILVLSKSSRSIFT